MLWFMINYNICIFTAVIFFALKHTLYINCLTIGLGKCPQSMFKSRLKKNTTFIMIIVSLQPENCI